MGQDSKSGGRGLYVDSIEVDPEGGESVLFPCQSWSEDDDLKTQKDIYPQVEPPSDSKPSKENFFDSQTAGPNFVSTELALLMM